MTPNRPEILRERGRSLEDEFCRGEDKLLMERLRGLRAAGSTREALAKASGMSEQMGPDETTRFKTELLARARAVANATGGRFGVGSKISASEATMLAKLEAAFTSSP
jgi:hypothetical protein